MKLFLLGMEHECATRVPDKPLRPFAGTTLFDIYLKKFKALQGCDLFDGQGIALWRGDKRLWKKAEAAGVPIIERSEASAKGHGDYKVIFEFLKDVDADSVLRVSCCSPFVQVQTLCYAAAHCHNHLGGYTLIKCERKWGWHRHVGLEPINGNALTSQAMEPIEICTHGAMAFRRDVLLETGECWTRPWQPWRAPCGPIQAIDIDTEEDFDLARRIAESFTEEEWQNLYQLRDM